MRKRRMVLAARGLISWVIECWEGGERLRKEYVVLYNGKRITIFLSWPAYLMKDYMPPF